MRVTLPDGTIVEGTKEEIQEYLPPVPQRNWDGSLVVTCETTCQGYPVDEPKSQTEEVLNS